MRAPLASIAELVEVAGEHSVAEGVRQSLCRAAEQSRFLLELVTDYQACSQLEADAVVVVPTLVPTVTWIDSQLQGLGQHAEAMGWELVIEHRSFLPDIVEFDWRLAAQALEAVARTALHRAHSGPLTLVIAYDWRVDEGGHLEFEVHAHGGGFAEIDQGYAFVPFGTQDAMQRPVLGLSVAQRLLSILGGSLTIESPRLAACTYRVRLPAPLAAGAMWVDPRSERRESCADEVETGRTRA